MNISIVDEIKQKLDIVDIISTYVKLQKSGRNFKANCPFHSEKMPSFFVFPDKQTWHCFGACGTGGDIFSFIMKKEGLDFSQALHILADKANITLKYHSAEVAKQEHEKQERLFKINEIAAEFFHYFLQHSSEGNIARKYTQLRGLSDKVIESFQLGYAPSGWDYLIKHMASLGYSEGELLAAGLIVAHEGGGYYDRFRNRLIFPIRDIKNQVIGFGGRVLDDSLPKYLNTPQTALFDKSSVLYGIEKAQAAIRQKDSAVITEGYMDTITAHQYGFENTVASMGTALTDKQISILRKLSKNIIIALDADQAGLEATVRSIATTDRLIPKEYWIPWTEAKTYGELVKYEIQVVEIHDAKDPDEIIRKSPEKWQKLLSLSQPIIDFTLKKEIDNINKNDPKDRTAVVTKFLPILYQINDPVRRAHYVNKLAQLLHIDERFVTDALFSFQSQEEKRRKNKTLNAFRYIADFAGSSRFLEEYCLALLLNFPDLRDTGTNLPLEYFDHSENRDVLSKWKQNSSLHSIKETLDPALSDYFDYLLNIKKRLPSSLHEDRVNREGALNDCVNRLQELYLKNLEAKKKMILSGEAENGNVEEQINKLIEQGIQESQQLKEIFKKRSHFYNRTKGV